MLRILIFVLSLSPLIAQPRSSSASANVFSVPLHLPDFASANNLRTYNDRAYYVDPWTGLIWIRATDLAQDYRRSRRRYCPHFRLRMRLRP